MYGPKQLFCPNCRTEIVAGAKQINLLLISKHPISSCLRIFQVRKMTVVYFYNCNFCTLELNLLSENRKR